MQRDKSISVDQTPTRREELIGMIVDTLRRTIVHYGLWWKEVERHLGLEECLAVEAGVWTRTFGIYMARLAKILGFEVDPDGIPAALKTKSVEELQRLLEAVSVNWLANDGIWFQAVENRHDLPTAQECNNAAWSRFSPFEAGCIRTLHEVAGEHPLDVLAAALERRLYANINQYTLERPEAKTLILYMNDCRVQSARKRKGLEDYPCKSGGLVEYITFASAIDSHIKTECIGCPPDPHPEEWFCAWRFTV